jgi:uroporphyrinogen decarboxylase
MTSQERVMAAVEHRHPDKPPLMYRDVPEVRTRLLKDLQLRNDDELYEAFGIDFRWVEPQWIGPALESSPAEYVDQWGVGWKYTKFSEAAGYWNVEFHPLIDQEDLDALRSFPIPDVGWWDFSEMQSTADRYADYAIMSAPGVSSPGILQYPIQTLIGAERSLVELYSNPDFIHSLIDRVLEFLLPFVQKMTQSCRLDFFRMGDDYGTQQGQLIGTEQWNNFFRDPLQKLSGAAKQTGARFYLHSCGSVRNLIPSLLDIGLDVLDPLQVGAAEMDPGQLKEEFGNRLTFSGGVDEQDLLPRGTPAQIREEVWRLLDIMMPGGGFILGPTHNFQADVPTANIVAMYKAARDWAGE